MIDKTPHPSVQPWSRGELFPAVIAKVELYLVPTIYLEKWELSYPGEPLRTYRTREQAEAKARELNMKAVHDRAAAKCFAAANRPGLMPGAPSAGIKQPEPAVVRASLSATEAWLAHDAEQRRIAAGIVQNSRNAWAQVCVDNIKAREYSQGVGKVERRSGLVQAFGSVSECEAWMKTHSRREGDIKPVETLAGTYPELNKMVREACREEIKRVKLEDKVEFYRKRLKQLQRPGHGSPWVLEETENKYRNALDALRNL